MDRVYLLFDVFSKQFRKLYEDDDELLEEGKVNNIL